MIQKDICLAVPEVHLQEWDLVKPLFLPSNTITGPLFPTLTAVWDIHWMIGGLAKGKTRLPSELEQSFNIT